MQKVKFALTHASGMLAEALLERMADAGIKSENIVLLDQEQHEGERISYAGSFITLQDQDAYDYENLTAVLLLESDPTLQGLLQHADCYVFSHQFDPQTPNVLSAEMSEQHAWPEAPCFIRMASAEQATLIPLLKIIHTDFGLKSIDVVNVETAAAYGKAGVKDLAHQTISLLNTQDVKSSVFPLALAFNMMPLEVEDDVESSLLTHLQLAGVKCSAQRMLVAAFHGLAISVMLETDHEISIDALSQQFGTLSGVKVSQQSVSPMTDCKEGFDIHISGLRHPQKDVKRLQFWIIADSVRNGLVQNYLNTMEILLKSHL
ncbi:MAG: hypothetical protein H8E21_11525 [Gammaproteobacteria bacterium]|nr:hypothetical protein [Gammaproteobacteria bacterium]MBL6998228.1 hypothetical protein [Gammaproteobacteria bacterium]